MYRNKKLLELARQCPFCNGCGKANDSTIVAAHSNQLRDGKGRGLKAHDYRISALCYNCHYTYDQGSHMSKLERTEFFDEAHRKFIGWLFENNHIEIK